MQTDAQMIETMKAARAELERAQQHAADVDRVITRGGSYLQVYEDAESPTGWCRDDGTPANLMDVEAWQSVSRMRETAAAMVRDALARLQAAQAAWIAAHDDEVVVD